MTLATTPQRTQPESIAKLIQLSDDFDDSAAVDPIRADEADLQFHLHLVRATRFPHLYQLVENSKIQQLTIWRRSYQGVDYRKLAGCHRPILEAIEAKDEDRVLHAIWDHSSIHALLGESWRGASTRQ